MRFRRLVLLGPDVMHGSRPWKHMRILNYYYYYYYYYYYFVVTEPKIVRWPVRAQFSGFGVDGDSLSDKACG